MAEKLEHGHVTLQAKPGKLGVATPLDPPPGIESTDGLPNDVQKQVETIQGVIDQMHVRFSGRTP